MSRIVSLALLFVLPGLLAAGEEPTPPVPPVNVEELIKQLGSEDFDIREAASRKLKVSLRSVRPKLKEALAAEKDPEIVLRLHAILNDPVYQRIEAWLETARKEWEDAEEDAKTQKTLFHQRIYRCQKLEEALQLEESNLTEMHLKRVRAGMAGFENLELQLRRLQEERDQAIAQTQQTKQALEVWERRWRMERAELATRFVQLQALLDKAGPDLLLTLGEYPLHWRPILVSFEERLALPLSFEMVDLPLEEALALWEELSGLKVTLELGRDESPWRVSLRVKDMNAKLALDWIAKLSDLEVRVNKEQGTLTMGKKPAEKP